MTKVSINPGICGLVTEVEVNSEEKIEFTLKIKSACKAVRELSSLGEVFDAYEVCLTQPGKNIFYEYASKNFPAHAACPTIAGILKAIEVECGLALKKDCEIKFID